MKAPCVTPLLIVVLLAVGPAVADAQRAHIGPQAGYNFDSNRAFVGAHLLLPLGSSLEFYPSFDYYFVDAGSLIGLRGDLKLRVPARGPSVLYLGAGIDFRRAAVGGAADTDTGWDFLFGLESRIGLTHPFVEGRVLNHNNSAAFQVGAGLNLTLF